MAPIWRKELAIVVRLASGGGRANRIGSRPRSKVWLGGDFCLGRLLLGTSAGDFLCWTGGLNVSVASLRPIGCSSFAQSLPAGDNLCKFPPQVRPGSLPAGLGRTRVETKVGAAPCEPPEHRFAPMHAGSFWAGKRRLEEWLLAVRLSLATWAWQFRRLELGSLRNCQARRLELDDLSLGLLAWPAGSQASRNGPPLEVWADWPLFGRPILKIKSLFCTRQMGTGPHKMDEPWGPANDFCPPDAWLRPASGRLHS